MVRSWRDIQNSNRHNETKAEILFALIDANKEHKWLTSSTIADMCNLTLVNASRQLTKLTGQGYIWRKNVGKRFYRYRYLKPMGERVAKELWIRIELKKRTGDQNILLNLKEPIPHEYHALNSPSKDVRVEVEQDFNLWFYSA